MALRNAAPTRSGTDAPAHRADHGDATYDSLDLGTLGGDNGFAGWVNDAGAVAGNADLPDGTHHGFLWRNGHMRDLPPVNNAPCSNGNAVNNRDEVVGNLTDCQGSQLAAAFWSNGRAYDLNTLVAPSALHLTSAEYINSRGEIVGHGVLPNGDRRVFLLIRNPSVPLPAADPSPTGAPHVRAAQTTPALAGPCAALPAARADRLAWCGRWQ